MNTNNQAITHELSFFFDAMRIRKRGRRTFALLYINPTETLMLMANLKMCVWCDDDGWDYNEKLIERFGDFDGGSFPRVCYATGGERTIFEEYELRLAEAYGLIEDEHDDYEEEEEERVPTPPLYEAPPRYSK